MKAKLPPLTWLRAFEASARHLSFTNAADELNLTQAAISKQIKLLEHYLREPLFRRKPRSLELTRVGAAYLPKVHDSFERLAIGTEEVFGNRSDERLTVRVAVGFAVNWLAARLPLFAAEHPATPIRLVSTVWNEPLDKESFDLDIRYGTGNWSGYQTDRLTWEQLTPLCSPSLLEGPAALREPEDLQHQTLLHVLGYEEGWAIWLNAAGARQISAGQGMQFDTSLMAFEVAARGLGVALGRTSLMQTELDRERLVAPFGLSVPVNEAFYLISPQSGALHPHADLFRDWLLTQAAGELPSPATSALSAP